MGLDSFNSDSSSSSTKSEPDESNAKTDEDVEHEPEFITTELPEDSYTHPSSEKDFKAEYSEEYHSECWECGERKTLIPELSSLGNLWFCQNPDCNYSLIHRCEVTASTKDIADKLNYRTLQGELLKEDFNPENMSLDNFTGDSEQTSENKRQSEMFTKAEFEKVLGETGYQWEPKDYSWTGEWVYETSTSNQGFVMRIYSSIDKNTNESREKDSDAIRLVVLHGESEQPVLSEKRTNRIKTWKKNLKKKIRNISSRKDELEFCPECSRVMVIRENSDSGDKFLGCTGYPDCENTESIN